VRAKHTESDEVRFFADTVGLSRRLQSLYVESRALAQREEWRRHLDVAVTMVPCFEYLRMYDWVARILGRMAWSYVGLGEEGHSIMLLELAEGHDLWQATAGYYWAAEYSHRAGGEAFGRRCLRRFRELCVGDLRITEPPAGGDLGLAVVFYDALVKREEDSGSFQDKSNQSDYGRFYELRGRLQHEVAHYEMAARYYEAADLDRYAACCRVLRSSHVRQTRATPT